MPFTGKSAASLPVSEARVTVELSDAQNTLSSVRTVSPAAGVLSPVSSSAVPSSAQTRPSVLIYVSALSIRYG